MTPKLLLRALAGTVAALAVASAAPVPGEAVAVAYLLFLGLLAVAAIVPVIVRPQGGVRESAFERALARRPSAPGRPEELVRLEDQVSLAVSLEADLRARLRPLVAEVAAQRLRSRHGLDLERDREAARALLGEEAWALVAPDAPRPPDRFAPGIPPARLARILDAVEAL